MKYKKTTRYCLQPCYGDSSFRHAEMKKDVSGDYVLFSDVDAAMDLVGQLSDRADNFAVAGSDIPLSDDMHRRQLIIGMEGLRDELRSIVRQVTGSNPWVK